MCKTITRKKSSMISTLAVLEPCTSVLNLRGWHCRSMLVVMVTDRCYGSSSRIQPAGPLPRRRGSVNSRHSPSSETAAAIARQHQQAPATSVSRATR